MDMKNSIATSLEQSKLLLELGIDPNTASMCRYMETPYITDNIIKCCAYSDAIVRHSSDKRDKISPAWTLGDLLDLLPQRLGDKNLLPNGKDHLGNSPSRLMIELGGIEYFNYQNNANRFQWKRGDRDTLIDVAVRAIEELKKKGII